MRVEKTRLLRVAGSDGINRESASGPLAEFHVWWDNCRSRDVRALRRCLGRAKKEAEVQRFLESRPLLLVQHLGGGHGRWVIPQKRLGSEFVTDFLIAQKNSLGFFWTAVELESPSVPMFNRKGDPSRWLVHAIRQVQDWRAWLKRNRSYATRSRAENGLGLVDIDGDAKALILMSRRHLVDGSTDVRRREMSHELRIDIHTYDYLVDTAASRAQVLEDPDTWHEYDPAEFLGVPIGPVILDEPRPRARSRR